MDYGDDRYDVLISAEYFCDIIFTGLPRLPALGTEIFSQGFEVIPGAAFSPTLTLHRLGARVGWACDFGSDFFSQFVLAAARREGLDPALFRLHDMPFRLVTVSLSYPHDRAFITYVDQWQKPSLIPLIEQHRPRWIYRMALHTGPEHHGVVEAARAAGSRILMDCQSQPQTLDDPAVVEAIRAVDVFAPNATEALHLTGEAAIPAALARLASLAPLVVIKLGADGSIAQQGDTVIHVPGLPVNVVDTTGAGDCFNAAFLYGQARGEPLETCLRYGNICGALSTTDYGGRAVPTAAQLHEGMRRYD